MRTPLAWLNLAHNKMRSAAAVAGVTFAVVLIFLQLGFLASARFTAHAIYDRLDFDLLIRPAEYRSLSDPKQFSRQRLYQAGSVSGVAAAVPLHAGANQWQNPHSGQKRRILALGARPHDAVFRDPQMQQELSKLTVPEFVLVDRRSRPDFGPRDGRSFGDQDIGSITEIAGRQARIVGLFLLWVTFEADGTTILSEEGFQRVTPGRSPDDVSLGLLRLAEGADLATTEAAVRRALPNDVDVLSRDEVRAREQQTWVQEMSVGVIFRFGVMVAMVVGAAIVYQILSSDVANHLAEYATLKAVGYSARFLGGVVIQQALILALLGFLPGLAIAQVLYWITESHTRMKMELPWDRIVMVLGIVVVLCTLSGLGALRKLRQADPADLF